MKFQEKNGCIETFGMNFRERVWIKSRQQGRQKKPLWN